MIALTPKQFEDEYGITGNMWILIESPEPVKFVEDLTAYTFPYQSN